MVFRTHGCARATFFFYYPISNLASDRFANCELRTDASGRALSRSSLGGRRGIGLDRMFVISG